MEAHVPRDEAPPAIPRGISQNVELTPEQKRMKIEREVLYIRYKLQKGLLTTGQQPKEEDMEQMSKFLNKLEWYPNIETSIIRSTKIHKVLKCILKLDGIPKESEFQFKSRSRTLLEMWNKVLGSGDQSTTSRPTLVYSEQPATPVPIQTSSETIPPPVETQVEVIGDWVLVIHAEEGNVVMEEDALNVA